MYLSTLEYYPHFLDLINPKSFVGFFLSVPSVALEIGSKREESRVAACDGFLKLCFWQMTVDNRITRRRLFTEEHVTKSN